MSRSRENWPKHRKKVKNKESLPKNAIRRILNYHDRGVSPEKIHEILTKQKEISASLETVVQYIKHKEKLDEDS